MRILFFILLLILSSSIIIYAQKSKIDSLEYIIRLDETSDSTKIHLYIELAELIRYDTLKKAFQYLEKATSLYHKEQHLYKEYCLIQIKKSHLFIQIANQSQALYCLLNALAVIDRIEDPELKGTLYKNIAFIYSHSGDQQKALEYYEISLDYYLKSENNSNNIAFMYNNMADSYLEIGQYEKSKELLHKALGILKEKDPIKETSIIYQTLGQVYRAQGKYQEANQNAAIAIQIADQFKFKARKVRMHYDYALSFLELGDFQKAQDNIDTIAKYLREDDKVNIYKFYDINYLYHKKKGNFQLALDYFEKASKVNDSIWKNKFRYQIDQIKTGFDSQLEIKNLKIEREQKDFERNIILLIALMILSFSTVLAYFIYQKQKANRLLLTQKNQIEEYTEELKNNLSLISKQSDEIGQQNEELKHQQEEINTINNQLEKIILERTSKLTERNKQLTEYAFFNAHKLRAPIATILGLYEILKLNNSPSEFDFILEQLKTQIELVDTMVRKSQDILNFEEENI